MLSRKSPKQRIAKTKRAAPHNKKVAKKHFTTRAAQKNKKPITTTTKKQRFSTAHNDPNDIEAFFSTNDPQKHILRTIKDDLLICSFNAPKTLNAMTIPMGEEMVDLVARLKIDNCNKIKCVILTGEDRAFSAGGDLKFLHARSLDTPTNNTTEMLKFYARFTCLRQIPQNVIAAINGPAIGAGAAVSLFADARVMSSKANWGVTFTALGLTPGMASSFTLPKICSSPAMGHHLLLSGEIINAEQALQYGLVNKVVPVPADADNVTNNQMTLDAAVELAKQYTKNYSPATFFLTKTIRAAQDVGMDNALLREAEGQALTYNSAEFKGRLDAMMNRKKK